MKWLPASAPLVAGLAVVAATNLILLGGVARNRSGTPAASLALTERELAMPIEKEEENSALLLRLTLGDRPPEIVQRASWLRNVDLPPVEHPWLDREKLRALGFQVEVDPADPKAGEYYQGLVTREAFLVLELEGEAWRRFLAAGEARVAALRGEVAAGRAGTKELEAAEQLLAIDRVSRSRLLPVDAGRDERALAARYPDRKRWAVVPGAITLRLARPKGGPPVLATMLEPAVGWINVPRSLRAPLGPFLPKETSTELRERLRAAAGWPAPAPPRYRGELAVGRGGEPWLVRVEVVGQ